MKKYKEYINSEIGWIGQIPKNWDIAPIRALCYLGRGRVISNEEIANKAGEYPVYSSQTSEDGLMGRLNTYDFDGEYVTWTTDGANAGTIFYRQGRFNCTNVCGTLKAKAGKVFPRYLPYVLNLGTKCYVRYDINPKLMNNEMAGIRIPLPTVEEQKDISRYIDRKTAQIDDLIAKKERMIELLKEERIAVINQAVTKGLNPKVEMKDFCIEWLGKVPKHWEVKKLKYVSDKVQTGITPPSERTDYYDGGNIDWYTPGDFQESIQLKNSFRKINRLAIEEGVARMFPSHSVLLIGIGATLGKVGIIESPSSSNQQINAIIFSDKFNPFFGVYYLQAIANTVISLSNTSTLAILNQTQTKDILALVPPLEEQGKIAKYIQSVELKHSEIVNKEQKQIDLLKEYRTALIFEAVTGKIDVRNNG